MHTFDDANVIYYRFYISPGFSPTMIQPTHLLDLPAQLRRDQIEITSQLLILSLVVETAEAACPLCQQAFHRVYSHYTRTLADLPCGGKALRLLVQVRRFFCGNEVCPQKIFAERLPELTSVYARRTLRATETLAELGFALGGKAASALSQHLGLESSRMTLLRIPSSNSSTSSADAEHAWSG
jgi:hypothetical protein